jgi:hypothetical protein
MQPNREFCTEAQKYDYRKRRTLGYARLVKMQIANREEPTVRLRVVLGSDGVVLVRS